MSPELSKSGHENGYYHQCKLVGFKRAYAACLSFIERSTANDPTFVSASHGECCSAIARGSCPALSMRSDEIDQHKAIYFLKREPFIAQQRAPDGPTLAVEPSIICEQALTTIDTTSFADVINQHLMEAV